MPNAALDAIVTMLRDHLRHDLGIEEQRAQMEENAGAMRLPADVSVTPVDAGGVPAEWVVAGGTREQRAVLYLHGGGYVIGSPRTHRDLTSRLSRACRARVLVPEYRLAPEYPCPAAVDDTVAAYRYLLAGGADPARTVIAGDSAGGGLAVAALVALRDAGEPLPAAAVCISPWVDLEVAGESATTRAGADPMVDAVRLRENGRLYGGDDLRAPLAAPLYADLTGLPPMLVQVGDAEILLDDAVRLAERAKAAGVEVDLEVWDEMIHVFPMFAGGLDEGRQAIERIGAWVEQRLC
jgi:monoterpene epsilon-lactone hydrolase